LGIVTDSVHKERPTKNSTIVWYDKLQKVVLHLSASHRSIKHDHLLCAHRSKHIPMPGFEKDFPFFKNFFVVKILVWCGDRAEIVCSCRALAMEPP